jgi:hypothetical protein
MFVSFLIIRMAENNNSSMIVAIVAIVVIVALGFLALRVFGGADTATPSGDGASINLDVGNGDGQ